MSPAVTSMFYWMMRATTFSRTTLVEKQHSTKTPFTFSSNTSHFFHSILQDTLNNVVWNMKTSQAYFTLNTSLKMPKMSVCVLMCSLLLLTLWHLSQFIILTLLAGTTGLIKVVVKRLTDGHSILDNFTVEDNETWGAHDLSKHYKSKRY